MNNKNKSRHTSKIKVLKNPTKSRWIRIGIFVAIVLSLLVTGTYVISAIKSKNVSDESAKTGQSDGAEKASSSNQSAKSEEAALNTDKDSSTQSGIETTSTAPEFSFADTSSWSTKSSRDGSFSIRYIQNLIYSTCPDLADNLMAAMVGPTESDIACGSLQEAVSVQPYKGHANTTVLRTETMIAQTEDVWDRNGTTAMTINLADGQTAQRYEYDSVIIGTNYHTIEYNTIVGGKRYVAVNNWQYNKSPNMSSIDFDTMIQKTWVFN